MEKELLDRTEEKNVVNNDENKEKQPVDKEELVKQYRREKNKKKRAEKAKKRKEKRQSGKRYKTKEDEIIEKMKQKEKQVEVKEKVASSNEEKKEENENIKNVKTEETETEENKQNESKHEKIKERNHKKNKEEKKKTSKEDKIKENKRKNKEKVEKKQEDNTIKQQKKLKIKKIAIIISVILLVIIAGLLFLILCPKFRDIQIELGTQEIKPENFVTSKIFVSGAEFVTDVSKIDLSQVGEYEIKLKYRNKEETVKLKIADTTAPEVAFQDITRYIDYQVNPEDFISQINDESETTVELISAPQITEFSDYEVTIKVKDKHGNETVKTCKLTITWLKTIIYIELGGEVTIADLVFDEAEYGESILKEDIDNIDTSVIGEYIVRAERDGTEYQSKIIVQDTTPPVLELKDITIYDDEKISDYTRFIKNVSDASGEPTTTLKTEIDYSIKGQQNVVIEAVDMYGNKTEATAILTIKADDDGPVISGVRELSVSKNQVIDYYAGVSSRDAKDGTCEVKVDSSTVNTSVAGTYYATYTSTDTKGNKTTVKRKITVEHDQADTNAKFDEFYNNYLAGKDIVSMASAIRQHVSYNSNWGGNDPVWYGLTEGRGNCYVHASIMKRALDKAGYANYIIYLEDQSHYWNLVNVNGVWRHIDATPSVNHTLGLLTDEQKLADPGVHQKTWDRTAWPAAQ